MRYVQVSIIIASILILIVPLIIRPALAQSLAITGPDKTALVEGKSYSVSWKSDDISKISIIAYGIRTPLGAMPRGSFAISISSAVAADRSSIDWKVPWIDSILFHIKVKGYDASGRFLTSAERAYGFRPSVMADREKDGIYLDLHKRIHQRLYVQKNGKITHVYFVSSSKNYLWEPPNVHPPIPHDHAGVFKVLSKEPDHWSKLFHVRMLWAMRYLSGHYIHATSSNLYYELGRPASAGCNRMTRHDAHQLYEMTPMGTRVEVIGPKG